MRTFTACFRSQRPLQTCGPELKTKLYDPFELFSASYRAQVAKRVSEVIFINSFISDAQSSTTFRLHQFPHVMYEVRQWNFTVDIELLPTPVL